ncbi:TIGR02680 family protein [Bacillus carboniphilus]|uniref:TIGR02680 family protein n=1 Tax=Bacillus carboniphilus TaxID=86663 RepID=UPI0035326736
MTNSRWVMNRAGLLNFWYYDEETFYFRDGKLLLRGSNGSGKSVTMQSFLPVLLDGKKSPDRLDPFGSKARKMEDYLLGEKEVVDRDERTGYLFMEYKKQDYEQYITTGIGMQARRNKGIKTWYFLITDNRRIGQEFYLAQKHKGEKVPLSAKELENRIAQGGHVVHTQREYMELVNKNVFGFQSTEAYEDLIKLLIQLRSPKLSKDFKPTVIYEILDSALPPLTDDELRHLSDTIENMDQASQQLEQLERESTSIQKLESMYDTYNQYILAERAEQWKRAEQKKKKAEKEQKHLEKQHQQVDKEISQLQADRRTYEDQAKLAEHEKNSLQKHEVWSLEENKTQKKQEAESILKEIDRLQLKWDEHSGKLREAFKAKENTEIELSQHEQKAKEILEELALDAEAGAFHQHDINLGDYNRAEKEEFDFTVWLEEAKDHRSKLAVLEKRAEEAERLGDEHLRLQRESSEKKQKLDEKQKELDHLKEWFDEQHQQLESNVFKWIEEHPKLMYSTELRQSISRSLQGLYEQNRYDQVRDQLYMALHQYEATLKSEMKFLEKQKDEKLKEIDQTDEELHRIKTQKMIEPDRAEGTKQHRQKLQEENKAFVPFYAAVEFQDHVTEEQRERIESALKKTGVLDSVITDQSLTPKEDVLVVPNPRVLGYTLADYLMPDVEDDCGITNELVDEVLRSISLEKEDGGFHLDVDGTYSLGCLIGHAPNEGTSKFIGRTARKRHQQEQIRLWTEKLHQLHEQLDEIINQIEGLTEELQRVETWKEELPTDQELLELHEQLVAKKQEVEKEQDLLQRIDEQWKRVYEQLNLVKKELREKGAHLNLDLTKEEITKALEAAASYVDFLHQFVQVSLQVSHAASKLTQISIRMEELEEELDHVKGEQNSKQSQHSRLEAEIQSIEQQLQLKGIDEVRNRIQEVQYLLKEAEEKLKENYEALPKKEVELTTCLDNQKANERDLLFLDKYELRVAAKCSKRSGPRFLNGG